MRSQIYLFVYYLSKFIFDYGQTDRQLKLAALETKASILSTHTALNGELTKLLSNFVLLDGASQSLEIINAYLSKYKEREKTIKTAVSSGILSRADLLEIEAAKNNIDSQYERLKFTQSQSKKFLKTYLGEQYSNVSDEVNNRLANGYELIYSDTNVGADLLAVQKSVLETEIEIAQNFDKFRINANASVSSPSPNNDSFSTFAGFSITKPILDGGQSPATIDKKEADLEVLKQEITALEFERELVISSWETYKKTWSIPFGTPENFEQSELIETHKCVKYMGNMFVIMGLVGPLIGIVLMLQNKDDPKMAAPEIAIAIMSLFYSVILKGVCMHRASKIEQFIK